MKTTIAALALALLFVPSLAQAHGYGHHGGYHGYRHHGGYHHRYHGYNRHHRFHRHYASYHNR